MFKSWVEKSMGYEEIETVNKTNILGILFPTEENE